MRYLWRKSTYSDSRGQCVELARLTRSTIGVRDSKNTDSGHLILSTGTLAMLIHEIKANNSQH